MFESTDFYYIHKLVSSLCPQLSSVNVSMKQFARVVVHPIDEASQDSHSRLQDESRKQYKFASIQQGNWIRILGFLGPKESLHLAQKLFDLNERYEYPKFLIKLCCMSFFDLMPPVSPNPSNPNLQYSG